MHDSKHSEQIERMLDLMLCLPRSAWGLVLEEVNKNIGAVALQKILLRACDQSGAHMLEGLERGVVVFNRENKAQVAAAKTKSRLKQ
jgi:hypothetical protein